LDITFTILNAYNAGNAMGGGELQQTGQLAGPRNSGTTISRTSSGDAPVYLIDCARRAGEDRLLERGLKGVRRSMMTDVGLMPDLADC
jgi:hypothetical protein